MKSTSESPYWHRYLVTAPALVAKVIREEHVRSRGLRLHLDVYQREDDVPTILFVPGTGSHARCYAEFLFQLHRQGFRVVGIDLQGHGLSEGVRGSFTIEELVENIYDVTTWAIERYGEKVGISGSSLGGILTFYASAEDDTAFEPSGSAAVARTTAHDLAVPGPTGYHRRTADIGGLRR